MSPDLLLSHYRLALRETELAARDAQQGDYAKAQAALSRRSTIVRAIAAGSQSAPDWGRHEELDAAALALLGADRALEALLAFEG